MAQRHSHWFIMATKTNRHILGVAIAIYFHYGVIFVKWVVQLHHHLVLELVPSVFF